MGGVVWGMARGRGAAFKVFFPIAVLRMKKVLIVDDEPGLRQSLGLLLSDAGYVVTAEQNGRARSSAPRGYVRPRPLRRAHARDGWPDVPAQLPPTRAATRFVIVMSAYGGEDAAIAAMKEGAYDYLPKPFRPDEVVLTLRGGGARTLRQKSPASRHSWLSGGGGGLIVESAAMRQALELVTRRRRAQYHRPDHG